MWINLALIGINLSLLFTDLHFIKPGLRSDIFLIQ